MKFIAKSMLVLVLLALALGAIAYNLMSANVKQSGTINLANQNLSKQSRTVTNDVERVEMNGPFDLAIVRGDQSGLVLVGEERLLSKVVVQQDGPVLRINTKGMLVTMNQTVKLTLTIPKLTSVAQSGSGDSEIQGFSGPDINFELNGSGDLSFTGQYLHLAAQTKGSGNIRLEVGNIDHIELISTGSGEITAIGKAKKLTAISTGAGNIDTQRLISVQAEAVSNGSGNIKIYASKNVNVTSTGSGDIEIYGNPMIKSVTNTGSGEVSSN